METIIQQIVTEMIVGVAEIALASKLNFERMEPGVFEFALHSSRKLIRHLIEMTDQDIHADKAGRRAAGMVVERRADKRSVMTRLGVIDYERTYYLNKAAGTYSYPIDQLTGVVPYDRVDVGLSKALVSKSLEVSYARAVKDCCDGQLSPQTVMNKIRLAQPDIQRPLNKRHVPELHIDADEDHVALQDKHSKSRTAVPLISVYEGLEKNGKRNRCVNVFHCSSYGKSPDDLWEDVLMQIEQRYDLDGTKIYLHGDGADWIATGMDWLPNAKYVLDKYHKNKYLRQMLAGYDKKRSKQLFFDLNQALYDMDEDYFMNLTRNMLLENPNRAEKIKGAAKYLLRHMPAIAIHTQDPSAGNGGATEAHVSHVLSRRLSSRPMGWSKKTLKHFVSMLANGPSVSFGEKESLSCIPITTARAFHETKRKAKECCANICQSALPIIESGKRTELYKLLQSISLNYSL